MTTQNPVTAEGHDKLKAEYQHMVSVVRPKVIEAISTAREHGDLSENAEFKAAKEMQKEIESRIAYLDAAINNAQIIPAPTQREVLQFGNTAVIFDINDNKEFQYKIVGKDEADIKDGKISVFSPVARGLIGKRIGDLAVINAPGGEKKYEILDIK